MKAMLEQFAQHLTSEEREAVWRQVRAPRATTSHSPARWALAASAAAAAAFALMVTGVPPRAPSELRSVAPVPAIERAPTVARPTPTRRAAELPVRAAEPRVVQEPARVEPQLLIPPVPVPEVSPSPSLEAGVLSGRALDARQQPIAFANVIVLGTRKGTLTDEQGRFEVRDVPAGRKQVRLQAIGFDAVTQEVDVAVGKPTSLELVAGQPKVVKEIETIQVGAEKRLDTPSSGTRQSISAERLKDLRVDNLSQARAFAPGMVAQGGELHFRGGRRGEVQHQFERPSPAPAPQTAAPSTPQAVPITGGTALPNDQPFDAMFFKHHGVNPFVATDEDALSTFAVDVDNASYTLMRRYVGLGHLPPPEAVRVEEYVNFFAQGYPSFEHEDFRILVDGAPSAFGAGLHLLRVGIKGREVLTADRRPAHLTFVIDVSGSMAREDRLELVKRALTLLVDELRADDEVGIVVYGSQGRVLLEPVTLGRSGAGRALILGAIGELRPEGSTNAEEGIRLGYAMARRRHVPEHLSRIILCSDGVANVGRTGPESILAQVRSEADRGISLTTIGFGMGNYNDQLMEQLADKGDGNHYYVDDLTEAQRVFVENLTGTLQTIARDAKIQVEFDSTRVLRYRLIGFENRDVADRDFRNDKVDAGEIGAGHTVTALYEVKLAPRVTRGTIATVRLRYEQPEHEGAGAPEVREIAQRFDACQLSARFDQASPHLRLDAAVAEFGEILRESYWARESHLASVLTVARSAANSLGDAPSAEFVRLVEQASRLRDKAGPKVREAE